MNSAGLHEAAQVMVAICYQRAKDQVLRYFDYFCCLAQIETAMFLSVETVYANGSFGPVVAILAISRNEISETFEWFLT